MFARLRDRCLLSPDADARAVGWTNERVAGIPVGRLAGC